MLLFVRKSGSSLQGVIKSLPPDKREAPRLLLQSNMILNMPE